MNHIVAPEIFEKLGTLDHALAHHVITHHLAAKISACFDHTFDRLRVRPGHHHHVGGTGLGHHLGFEVTTVHRL